MAWDDGLTGVAREIAATNNSPLRVMAGPGTGKSFAMKRRAARLLEAGQNARRILAVTFTRNAAASLVDDLGALGVNGCENIRAGTLHSFCFGLLNKNAVFDFLGRVPRPVITFKKSGVLQFEGGTMLDDLVIAGAFGPKRTCTKRIHAFEAAWARLQSEQAGWPDDPIDRAFQTALLGWLRFHKAILIGELVPEALRYLRNNPACEERAAFDHVIVDEYQDLNRAEQDLIQLLCGDRAIAIVGDVDQSIYRFRHANPEGIQDYRTRFPATHDEVLNECRRCPTSVVAIADHLIKGNHPALAGARLRPLPTNPVGQIHIIQWNTIADEASGIADYVKSLAERNIPLGEILIMTPRRLLGYAIRDEIRARQIEVHSFYHEEAFETDEAQKAFNLLGLLANPDDRVALRWWLGHASPSKRRNAYSRLRSHCEASGQSPKEALEAMIAGHLALPNTTDLVDKYRELLAASETLNQLELPDLVDALMPANNDSVSVLREVSILALEEASDIEDLYEAVRSAVTQPSIPEKADYVRVMSLHKAKGLTSKIAIVSGCVQGLVPFVDQEAVPAEALAIQQEQRRLFYVAITRCTETLVVSSFLNIPRQLAWHIGAVVPRGPGAIGRTIASPFVAEFGPTAPAARAGSVWAQQGYG
jgi:superfamily I DNA/RNA helicase